MNNHIYYVLCHLVLCVVLLGITRELSLSLGESIVPSTTDSLVQHLLQRPLQHISPEPLEGLGGDDGGGHKAGVDDVREDPDGGLGLGDGLWLLEFSEHSPQESLVVVGEG